MPVVSVRVDRRTYEVLARMAEARGVSLYSFVKMLLEAQVSGEVSCRELERKLSEPASKAGYLEEKIRGLTTGNPARALEPPYQHY
jgi:hypothetical protein